MSANIKIHTDTHTHTHIHSRSTLQALPGSERGVLGEAGRRSFCPPSAMDHPLGITRPAYDGSFWALMFRFLFDATRRPSVPLIPSISSFKIIYLFWLYQSLSCSTCALSLWCTDCLVVACRIQSAWSITAVCGLNCSMKDLSFPPRDQIHVPCIAGKFLYH